MATEKELRNEIRKHVRKMLAEDSSNKNSFIKNVGAQVRASLGANKSMLDKSLGGVDVEHLTKLPKPQKVKLLTSLMKTFGISAEDLTSLRGQVTRGLKDMDESKLNELKFDDNSGDSEGTTLKGALGQKEEKLEDTPAYKSLVKIIEPKTPMAQVDFLLSFISKLPLKDNVPALLKTKLTKL
jgi:hypothetical protein